MPSRVNTGFDEGDAAPGVRTPHILLDDFNSLTNPTGAATSLLTTTGAALAKNLWPTFHARGDTVHVYASGTFNMHTASTLTWTIKCGSTTVATFGPNTSTSGADRGWSIDVRFVYSSFTAVIPSGHAMLRGPASAGFGSVAAAGDFWYPDGKAVVVSTLPQDFDITVTNATSDAASTVNANIIQVWHEPKFV